MNTSFYCRLMFFSSILAISTTTTALCEGAKWTGVDENVVEKFAEEAGRPARDPLINTDKGDLLLFVFLLAGTAGGFVAGYFYRGLFVDAKIKKETAGNV